MQRVDYRAGFSLMELMIAVALLTILVVKGAMLMKMVRTTNDTQTEAMLLNDQANLVLDRISLAIVGSDRDTLFPQFEMPVHTSGVAYSVSLGLDETGNIVWGDPESIGLEGDGRVIWKQNPDEENERRLVWSDLVRPFLEGELANGFDDNGNGLVDEQGLSFVLFKNSVTIRVSLGVDPQDPNSATRTVETTVTVRNRPD